jgi:predicted RNA-binding protein Jag
MHPGDAYLTYKNQFKIRMTFLLGPNGNFDHVMKLNVPDFIIKRKHKLEILKREAIRKIKETIKTHALLSALPETI